jgi:hypothetical protein
MADRVLALTWGQNVPGREKHGLDVFNEALEYYGSLQADGRIERFDVCIFDPNGFMDGFMLLHGSHEQLDAVREDARFMKLTVEASLVVQDLRLIDGRAGDGIAETMPLYQEAIAHAPQEAFA